jgi:hypothetical protein
MTNVESNPEGSRKRKSQDEEESPRKRNRTGNGDYNTHNTEKVQPGGSSQHQGRGRENTRVKEFPAGNATTSASRIAFLQSLCKTPKFLSLVDLVQTVVSC